MKEKKCGSIEWLVVFLCAYSFIEPFVHRNLLRPPQQLHENVESERTDAHFLHLKKNE